MANRKQDFGSPCGFQDQTQPNGKPPGRRAGKMKAEGRGQPDAQLAPAENSRTELLDTTKPQRKPKVSFFPDKKTKKRTRSALTEQRASTSTCSHRLLCCPEETSKQPPFHSGAERVDRCECSGQPARDAPRILRLNKKLNMQLRA